MICPKCGNQNDEDAKYCDECGAQLYGKLPEKGTEGGAVQRIRLRCRSCDGIMTADEDGKFMICPYCGSKELIVDNEKVALARLQARQEELRAKQEKEREEKEQRNAEKREEEESVRSFEKSGFRRVLIIFAILDIIFAMTAFMDHDTVSGIIAVVQMVLNLLAWLMGMHIFRTKRRNLPRALFVAGLMLILPYVVFFGTSAKHRYVADYKWEESDLAAMLEKPAESNIEIFLSSDNQFAADVEKITPAQYRAYVNSCKENGFTTDEDQSSHGYTAFSENGTKLELYYYDSMEEMSVRIIAPLPLGDLYWPSSSLADLLPEPDSATGLLDRETNRSFVIYIGETPIKKYTEYVQECIDRGFNINYNREERSFYAKNEDGYSLTVKYFGFDIMEIDLYKPDDSK